MEANTVLGTVQLEIPTFAERWNTADLVMWINSRNEPIKTLLEQVEAEVSEAHSSFAESRSEVERIKKSLLYSILCSKHIFPVNYIFHLMPGQRGTGGCLYRLN
ncbi:unnamed protein product [Gongylonema pulchrum]|uniref:SAM domain-containing protein n=1 Tax=Gongylonema pulchrum TaxID=637853 RepID=A0A183E151_9BILA|nr:unnamed protein product [Gongylonema pulchrum]